MAYSFPLSLANLSDKLSIDECVWDVKRNDELSGAGSGQTWQTQLATPLWFVKVKLNPHYHYKIKEVQAIIRKLQGAKNQFFLSDPISQYPYNDPTGSILGASTVTVTAISVDRQRMTLSGLPASYKLTAGDKGQINFGSPSKTYFFEISETVTANGSGVATLFEVFPFIPDGVTTTMEVNLKKPACKGFIVPGSFSPGVSRGVMTENLSFDFLERR